jgi:hypothetical protein
MKGKYLNILVPTLVLACVALFYMNGLMSESEGFQVTTTDPNGNRLAGLIGNRPTTLTGVSITSGNPCATALNLSATGRTTYRIFFYKISSTYTFKTIRKLSLVNNIMVELPNSTNDTYGFVFNNNMITPPSTLKLVNFQIYNTQIVSSQRNILYNWPPIQCSYYNLKDSMNRQLNTTSNIAKMKAQTLTPASNKNPTYPLTLTITTQAQLVGTDPIYGNANLCIDLQFVM